MQKHYESTQRDGVRLEYVRDDATSVEETLAALSGALASLAEYFELGDRCVKEILRVDTETPSHPWRLAMPQGTDLAIVSPRAYEGGPQYTPEGYRRLLVHETVHIVEEYLTPNVEGTARWWSEGLAVYFSGHWREELPLVQAGVRARSIPAIADMAGDAVFGDNTVRLCYTWGWASVRCIEQAHGRRAILKIVRECDDDDVFRTMGEERAAVEQGWQEWLFCAGGDLVPETDLLTCT